MTKFKDSLLTKNFFFKNKCSVWMSHQDSVYKLPAGFTKIASTKESVMTIIENKKKKYTGYNSTQKLHIQIMVILFLKIFFLKFVK